LLSKDKFYWLLVFLAVICLKSLKREANWHFLALLISFKECFSCELLISLDNPMTNTPISPLQYTKFCDFLERQCGIVLGEFKQYLVESRLAELADTYAEQSLDALVDKIIAQTDSQLVTLAVDAMTTNETFWFRDVFPFQLINEQIEQLLKKDPNKKIRIWSAACASGQEPFSIAMSIAENPQIPISKHAEISIIATDISQSMINFCKAPFYNELSLKRGLSDERSKRFFVNAGNGCMSPNEKILNMVSFQTLNLLNNFSALGSFDVIFCRNVLMYFSQQNKKAIIDKLADALNPGGYLLLGAAESINHISDRFEMIKIDKGFIFKLKN
jgi:chemotaxis protein methyltransferase CheR